jgi:inner membrane protein
MLLFGHLGITLGVALVCRQAYFALSKSGGTRGSRNGLSGGDCHGGHEDPRDRLPGGLFDLRFWVLGSILPDLIDKPLGHLFFSQFFGGNGRIYGHTLLFALLLFGIGLFLFLSKKKAWLLALGFGVLIHMVLDFTWRTPITFLWPLLGGNFPPEPEGDWILRMIIGLITSPGEYIIEIAGLVIMGLFVIVLLMNKGAVRFLKTGKW